MTSRQTLKVTLYKRFPWQKAVHDGLREHGYQSGAVHVVKAKRQVGKSLLIENVLLQFALEHARTTSIVLEPTLVQCRKMFKDLVRADVSGQLFTVKNAQLLELQLFNGSQILFKSAEQGENLRGFTVSGILCIDEGAYILDDIFDTVRPWVDARRAPILICSTPRFRQGFFYKQFSLGLVGSTGHYSYDWSTYDTSALLSPDRLEEYRQTMPAAKFATEYLGEFLDSDSILFKDFRRNIAEPKHASFRRLYVGIDWGSGQGGDSTAISGISEHGEQVFSEAFADLNTTQTIDHIAALYKGWKADGKDVRILAETNGIGRPFVDLLKQRGIPVREWTTSNQSKTDLVTSAQVAFENGAVTILPDPAQAQEISMYECEFNPRNGLVTYNAPQGFHDDRVIAFLLSLRCYASARAAYTVH